MTSVYNGRIDSANRTDHKNFGVVWAGSLYTIDSWVILKGSPNVDPAYKLLTFLGAPENQKQLPEYIAYGVTAKAATKLIDPKRLPDLPTAPENLAQSVEISDTFWLENLEKLTERFNKWTAR